MVRKLEICEAFIVCCSYYGSENTKDTSYLLRGRRLPCMARRNLRVSHRTYEAFQLSCRSEYWQRRKIIAHNMAGGKRREVLYNGETRTHAPSVSYVIGELRFSVYVAAWR